MISLRLILNCHDAISHNDYITPEPPRRFSRHSPPAAPEGIASEHYLAHLAAATLDEDAALGMGHTHSLEIEILCFAILYAD